MANGLKERAPRNQTLVLTDQERARLMRLLAKQRKKLANDPTDLILCGDYREFLPQLPAGTVDLLLLDPPYNLNKSFNGRAFSRKTKEQYTAWFNEILEMLMPLLRPTATVYICGDWHTSHSIYEAAERHLNVRNRITWEREKGRGAKTNWKNACEDIWFCTVSDDYFFDVEAVKQRRRVIAPYRDNNGEPKDWDATVGGNFRDTHPSNFWSDISIPFWSMPENTDHPTQKSEKLLAKLLLASSRPGDLVLDPFLGSGTTAVVAKKLGRRFVGIEIEEEYCLWALKRLERADRDKTIQGYAQKVFWERNTLVYQPKR